MAASKPISDEDIAYIKTQVKMVWVDGQPRFERIARKTGVKFGGLAGSILKDPCTYYRRLRFALPSGRELWVREHNLVWRFLHGVWPALELDHRDGDGLNNHPDNLRLATAAQNGANRRRGRADTNPAFGVSIMLDSPNRPFRAQLSSTCGGKRIYHRAYFATLEEAVEWRTQKAKEIHGDFARI